VKWHQCDKCDYKSKQVSRLKAHKSHIHDIDVEWRYCDRCNYKSKDIFALKQHKTHKINIHDVKMASM
jgi:C4-type Zn-finger protein